ncbi:MAG: tRNA (5-methylaminomethyl-2-thiouridine)(34)-methyltransferase MnmD [Bacteroidia bacterium]
MNSSPIVQKTADGSATIFLPELNETYHSVHGAMQESNHVFVKEGLFHLFNQGAIKPNEIRVFEVGLGTGLNAILFALAAWNEQVKIQYTGIEKYPLHDYLLEQLIPFQHDIHLFEKIHLCKWEQFESINPKFELKKIHADLISYKFDVNETYDLILMDAFAPDKQAEMWSKEIFDQLYSVMKPSGVLVTYSAKGDVKRAMRASGLKVNRIDGPPGKKHMLRAQKPIHEAS